MKPRLATVGATLERRAAAVANSMIDWLIIMWIEALSSLCVRSGMFGCFAFLLWLVVGTTR